MIRGKQIRCSRLVLVVDDQEINRDILGAILEDEHTVIYAENGLQAMELIRAHAKELSIVLLDLMMPVMNGFEVLEALQTDEYLRRIPVIVLTADKSAELRALKLGAADFITKPFDLTEVILARVGRIIELSEGRQLISAAEHDPLTTLYTRNFFMEYASRLYQYHPELHMDAIVLNIDQFHSINALKGFAFGDKVLRLIGSELRTFLSQTEGIAGRSDSDHFDLYCVCPIDYRELLDSLQKSVNSLSRSVSIHLRMGVQPWQEGVPPVDLLDRARAACKMVRGSFHHPMMVYSDKMLNQDRLNHRLLNDLSAAVEERQLRVYYQPKYDIQCDPPRLASAEALIRWKHPELGMVLPSSFIPLFEGNGMVSVVDNYVWNEAARQIAAWRDKFGITLPVSVNLSRTDVFAPSLTERLVRLVQENGLSFSDLKLEVTESAYTDNATQVLNVVSRLRELGFQIEMDDFGSGYSSLNMLSDMPIDVLKMDMKFIRSIETNETDRKLVSLILDIAKYLKVSVVAEGVETEGQLAILREGKCDMVQGYFFSRPLPPEEFEALILRELSINRTPSA